MKFAAKVTVFQTWGPVPLNQGLFNKLVGEHLVCSPCGCSGLPVHQEQGPFAQKGAGAGGAAVAFAEKIGLYRFLGFLFEDLIFLLGSARSGA
ncbi:MAG: hypothetical protein H7224_09255 [Polaromonas sp.]|nr:hypothetical protein [Polaromonas sp.]